MLTDRNLNKCSKLKNEWMNEFMKIGYIMSFIKQMLSDKKIDSKDRHVSPASLVSLFKKQLSGTTAGIPEFLSSSQVKLFSIF